MTQLEKKKRSWLGGGVGTRAKIIAIFGSPRRYWFHRMFTHTGNRLLALCSLHLFKSFFWQLDVIPEPLTFANLFLHRWHTWPCLATLSAIFGLGVLQYCRSREVIFFMKYIFGAGITRPVADKRHCATVP